MYMFFFVLIVRSSSDLYLTANSFSVKHLWSVILLKMESAIEGFLRVSLGNHLIRIVRFAKTATYI